ncbi:MAG: tetratricopeptide repeat protein [Vicinamibacteria bacterium]
MKPWARVLPALVLVVLAGPLAAQEKPAGPDGHELLAQGQAQEARYELDAAIAAYTGAAEKLSRAEKGEALGRLAIAQELRGMAAFVATADAALAADAQGCFPLAAAARARARDRRADESLQLAERAVQACKSPAALAALGVAQGAKGELGAAEAAYREALALAPGDLAARIGLARVLRRTGRAAEAEPMLAEITQAAPGAVAVYKEAARAKLALGRPDDAVADAAIAAAMSEGDAEAASLVTEVAVARALVQVKAGQADLAVVELGALRDKEPESASVRYGLGHAMVARRDVDGGLAELRKAVELDPQLSEAQFELGQALYALKGDPAGAIAPLELAVAAEPANPRYRALLGGALAGAQRFDRAVEELSKVVAAPEPPPEAWLYLGVAQLGASRFKEGAEALEKAAALLPQSAEAQAYLAWCYFGLKDAPGFKKAGAAARKLGYKDPQLLDRLKRVEAGEAIK